VRSSLRYVSLGHHVFAPEFEWVIVDFTVQSNAIAHPLDGRLLEIASHKVVSAAKRCGWCSVSTAWRDLMRS
jgi:hypothetical protein